MSWETQQQLKPADKILEASELKRLELETREGWVNAYLSVKLPIVKKLLASTQGLREKLSGPNVNPDNIDGMREIAERFHVDEVNVAAAAYAIKTGLV